jgi:hypothetical protein
VTVTMKAVQRRSPKEDVNRLFKRWGDSQFCIGLSGGGEIYIAADGMRIEDGHLLAVTGATEIEGDHKRECAAFALAPGKWTYYHAASVIHGSAVSVISWTEAAPKKK